MRFALVWVFGLFVFAGVASAQEPAWQTSSKGENFFASASGSQGIRAIVNFQKGRSAAHLFIAGLWPSRPLHLRLSVAYASGRRVPIDTYRFGQILEAEGERAYKIELTRAALRPLKGGDTLIIEDLTRRAEIPLTGSSKAIKAAEAAASGG